MSSVPLILRDADLVAYLRKRCCLSNAMGKYAPKKQNIFIETAANVGAVPVIASHKGRKIPLEKFEKIG